MRAWLFRVCAGKSDDLGLALLIPDRGPEFFEARTQDAHNEFRGVKFTGFASRSVAELWFGKAIVMHRYAG